MLSFYASLVVMVLLWRILMFEPDVLLQRTLRSIGFIAFGVGTLVSALNHLVGAPEPFRFLLTSFLLDDILLSTTSIGYILLHPHILYINIIDLGFDLAIDFVELFHLLVQTICSVVQLLILFKISDVFAFWSVIMQGYM